MNRALVFNTIGFIIGVLSFLTPLWGVGVLLVPLSGILILGEISSKVAHILDWPHMTDEEHERIHRRRH